MVALSFPAVIPCNWPAGTLRLRSTSCVPHSVVRCGIAEPTGEPAPLGQKTKYNDGLFEKAFMTLFARKMDKFAAPASKKAGKKRGWFDYDYESFVDVSKRVMQGRSRSQQQEVVREVLLSMLPPGAPAQVCAIQSVLSDEYHIESSIILQAYSMQNKWIGGCVILHWMINYPKQLILGYDASTIEVSVRSGVHLVPWSPLVFILVLGCCWHLQSDRIALLFIQLV